MLVEETVKDYEHQERSPVPLRLSLARVLCRALPPVLGQRLRSIVYPWNTALRHSADYVVRCQTGSLFKANTGDFTCYPMSVHGYNTFRNWAIALAVVRPGDTIIEVGANTGTETMGFSDFVGPSGKVIAFEPLPRNLKMLDVNLRLNKTRNVTVLPLALGNKQGTAEFHLPTSTNSGIGYLKPGGGSGDAITVEVETLDNLADRIGPSKLMAMDAEGAELLVLQGGRKYVSRHKPIVILEAQKVLLDRLGLSLAALRDELTGLGYELFLIERWGLKRLSPTVPLEQYQGDWLCVPGGGGGAVEAIRSSLWKCALMPCIPGFNPMTRASRS